MSFDPNLLGDGTLIEAAELRGQFTGLKTLIAAGGSGVPGPQGDPGPEGPQGPAGDPGDPQEPQREPGEVSNQQLADAVDGTASNVNGVGALNPVISDPPTQREVQAVMNKLNELIGALHR